MRFLARPEREALYGGAAGGGKSSALLMGALLGVDAPDYSAILFRRTYSDLALPGALMDRSHEWLDATEAHWNDVKKTWTFPTGATLSFGYLENERDKYRYQGAEFNFCGFDELTQFGEGEYRYLFSRLRRGANSVVPPMMRAASNPGGRGHRWVFERFIRPESTPDRTFVPATLEDNPHLKTEEYEQSLDFLDEITRQQLRQGLWVEDNSHAVFKREHFERFDASDLSHRHASVGRYIFYDTAYEEKESSDYTAWAVYDISADYRLKLMEVGWEKLAFPDLIGEIEARAMRHNQDGKLRAVVVEQAGSGRSALQALRGVSGGWLAPYLAAFKPGSRKKTERAREAAIWARKGCVLLPTPSEAVPWLHETEEELFHFPNVEHDDRTDAVVMGPLYLQHVLSEGVRFRQSSGAVA